MLKITKLLIVVTSRERNKSRGERKKMSFPISLYEHVFLQPFPILYLVKT